MPVKPSTIRIDPARPGRRTVPRLLQILRVLARHGFLGALRGRKHWPPPLAVRETFEELGLTFIKFGEVLALRRDLLPAAYFVGGSMLLMTSMGGWHETLGATMIISGIAAMFISGLDAWRRSHVRR